jgi:hypothetical protein
MMNFPVGAEDVKVVHGRSTGLQVVCTCGCVNFNYLDPQDTLWRCRNCRKVLSNDFPRLLESAVARQKQIVATAAAAPPTATS